MEQVQHYLKHEKKYLYGFVFVYFVVDSLVRSTSQLMEHTAAGRDLPFAVWEPFVWEFSSSIMIALLIPMVAWLIESKQFSWVNMWANVRNFLLWSLAFSVVHVVGMVLLREIVYWVMDSHYSFGHWAYRFFYEYRKDVMTFSLLLIVITGYRSTVQRLRGEASLVPQGEEASNSADRILVKKLGAEFIIKLDDIQWFESSGNYVNVYVDDRVYPLRSTMEKFITDVADRGFARTHRSFGVNLDFVKAIEASPAQSGEVLLNNERRVPLSKRYNAELRSTLSL